MEAALDVAFLQISWYQLFQLEAVGAL